jgi:hypothetical protein
MTPFSVPRAFLGRHRVAVVPVVRTSAERTFAWSQFERTILVVMPNMMNPL